MPRNTPYLTELAEDERIRLETAAQKYTAPCCPVIRAGIVLLAAGGYANDEIAAKLNISRQIVSKWRKRFFEEGIFGLEDNPGSGRPARFSPLYSYSCQGNGM